MSRTGGIVPEACALVAERLGLALSDSLAADLEHLLRSAGGDASLGLARLRQLPTDSPEWGRLASALTVNESWFFRDPALFAALETRILPELIAARRSEGRLSLRLWSAGCATGEEAYSLAILLDRLLPDREDWSVTLLGTDVDPAALAAAGAGVYRDRALRATPADVRARYFRREGPHFGVGARVGRLVRFAPFNLACPVAASEVGASEMDLVLCRHVMMYLTPSAQARVAALLVSSLAAGGWLVVAPCEAGPDLVPRLQPSWIDGSLLLRALARPGAAERPLEAVAVPRPRNPPAPARRLPASAGGIVSGSASSDPGPDGLLARARARADAGDLDEAQRLCRSAAASGRLRVEAWLLLAAIEQERGDLDASLRALRRATYLDPDAPAAHFLTGALQIRQGRAATGRRAFETALRLLEARAADEPVPGAEGVRAGHLRKAARVALGRA